MVRSRRNPKPLDATKLEELALAYVARFSTTRAKLEVYLARKLRERGWEGEDEPPVSSLAMRFVEAGYIDDAAYARAKADSLLRRGYGKRRVGQALTAAGVEEQVRAMASPREVEQRSSAKALAKKRKFGPFGGTASDRAMRQKQIAAMLRAGHVMDHVLYVIDAQNTEMVDAWIEEAAEEE